MGLLADWPGLGPAFLLPAIALFAILFFVPRFRTRPDATATAAAASS
jgi:hypothetical protein